MLTGHHDWGISGSALRDERVVRFLVWPAQRKCRSHLLSLGLVPSDTVLMCQRGEQEWEMRRKGCMQGTVCCVVLAHECLLDMHRVPTARFGCEENSIQHDIEARRQVKHSLSKIQTSMEI